MVTYTAKQATATAPVPSHGMAGDVKALVSSLELGTALVAADILKFGKVPAGAVAFTGWLQGDDLDTGVETIDIDIGWAANGVDAADPDGFGNLGVQSGDAVLGVKPEVSIWMPLGGLLRADGPKLFTVETGIEGVVNVAAATGGTGTLTLALFYIIDPNWTKTAVS